MNALKAAALGGGALWGLWKLVSASQGVTDSMHVVGSTMTAHADLFALACEQQKLDRERLRYLEAAQWVRDRIQQSRGYRADDSTLIIILAAVAQSEANRRNQGATE